MPFLQTIFRKLLTRTIFIHTCCWALFIVYELGSLYSTTGKLEPLYIYACFYAQNITFFYLVVRILNFTFEDKLVRFIKGPALYLVLFLFYLVLKLLTEYFLEPPARSFSVEFAIFVKFIANNLSRGFYFTVLAMFYWAAGHIGYYKRQALDLERRQLLAQRDKAELEIQLNNSQNAYLKQQLNPHLLFNSLNFIYSKVHKSSAAAADCVLLLSEIMRFSLEESGPDGKIILSEEIAQLKNLLRINEYRYDKDVNIALTMEGNFAKFRIIPLVLLSLTENLVKHANLIDPKNPAVLQITVDETGQLLYHSRNLKKGAASPQHNHAIGLNNVRIRLNYSYPGKHVFTISETADFYELTLNLQL